MNRRKGELTPSAIDRGWPYQVALPEGVGAGLDGQAAMETFCKKLLKAPRGHSVFYEDRHYNIHCFAVKTHAEAFMAEFGGEWFDPSERGKGVDWNKWYKGRNSTKR